MHSASVCIRQARPLGPWLWTWRASWSASLSCSLPLGKPRPTSSGTCSCACAARCVRMCSYPRPATSRFCLVDCGIASQHTLHQCKRQQYHYSHSIREFQTAVPSLACSAVSEAVRLLVHVRSPVVSTLPGCCSLTYKHISCLWEKYSVLANTSTGLSAGVSDVMCKHASNQGRIVIDASV